MNADQIAEIRPAIREAIDGAPNRCVTLQVTGKPAKWVQIVQKTVNAAYPHSIAPQELGMFSELEQANVIAWKAGKFATFEFGRIDPTALAQWIDGYFVRILGCLPGQYHVDVICEQV